MHEDTAKDLLHFISRSPSPFHASYHIKKALLYSGYHELREEDRWEIIPGGRYVVTRGGTALIAFTVPKDKGRSFHITAAHCDSPTFKIKENPELHGDGYIRINTEGYGGMIMHTWTDRPLSVAGQIFIRQGDRIVPRLVAPTDLTLLIPSVAIHMHRTVNQGHAWNMQNDLTPLYALTNSNVSFLDVIAQCADTQANLIMSHDLFLYPLIPGRLWGPKKEFVSSPKLDDLQCAFSAFRGFTSGIKEKHIAVYALFDNEETGSATNRGAGSTFLHNVLMRLLSSLGFSYDESLAFIARSFLISADNANAVHPNHPELSDPTNRPVLNGGIVIKQNAQQKYATDGFSAAYFRVLCEKEHIPVQTFANRSDMPGGSTLGTISDTQVSMPTVDVGLPQLAMHSSYETAGTKDTEYLIQAVTAFFA